jgi:hypothetical protein
LVISNVSFLSTSIQCELKSWQKVEQLSNELMTANKDDVDFLQSLAAVAMSVKDATVSDEMTCPKDNARPQQLPDTFVGEGWPLLSDNSWPPSLPTACAQPSIVPRLTHSLLSTSFSSVNGTLSFSVLRAKNDTEISVIKTRRLRLFFFLCRRLTSVLFDDLELLQEPLQRFRYDAMNVLQDCLRSPNHPFAQVTKLNNILLYDETTIIYYRLHWLKARWMLTKIRNVSLLCTDQRLKRNILRYTNPPPPFFTFE